MLVSVMTIVRQLYELQELDLEIAQVQNRVASIDGELGDRSALEVMKSDLDEQGTSLRDFQRQRRTEELEAESVRQKVTDIEGKLYGGSVKSVRELESGQKEVLFIKEQLGKLDDQLLETMMVLDEGQSNLKSLEGALAHAEDDWQTRQTELSRERQTLEATLASLQARRQDFVSRVGQRDLGLYEGLRSSKAGEAIAKVERGLCRGCRMALPTHQLQRARLGRETVLCNSCGRILFVS